MVENVNTLDREVFLQKYHLSEVFSRSELQWEVLQKIYRDYQDIFEDVKKCCKSLEDYCRREFSSENIAYHSMRCRPKDSEHLIEKIIRKRGREQSAKYNGINANNYKDIIQDLIGLRILVLKKEDWEIIFDKLVQLFPMNTDNNCHMVENPVAYIRYGDRDIYKDKIKKEYSNKDYRSQHYIIKFEGFFCEIQVRTLAEEVYGEFDHLVKYPYRNDNNFLMRYTNTLSKLTNAIDEMMSTCIQMSESGWETNASFFEKDQYENWSKTAQSIISEPISEEGKTVSESKCDTPVNVNHRACDILLRKEKR